nr:MAG TPA: hypothetical protein [Caudoviricetes sp.]
MKQLLFCVHDANGRGPAHCLRRGRRRRQQSPRCGPRRWRGRCSPATGRPGGHQAPGPEARAKAHDLVGARSASESAPKPNESRALDNAIGPKASSASNPRRCIASVAWLASWLQRTCSGWGCATVAPVTWRAAPIRCGSRPQHNVAQVTTAPRAHAYSSLPLFLYPFFTLSLSLYKKEGSS